MWTKRHTCGGCGEIVLEWPYFTCPKCKKNDELKMVDIKPSSARIQFINEQKNKPCTDCGVSYPYYVMDFDHLPQYEKKFAVSRAVLSGKSIDQIREEIAKCELVCANCHRIRTHNRGVENKILKEAELPIL